MNKIFTNNSFDIDFNVAIFVKSMKVENIIVYIKKTKII